MTDDGKRRWKGPTGNKKSSGRRAGERKVIAYRAKSESSKKWIERQLSDPYVQKAQSEGFRARAAYKLLELDEQAKLLRPGMRVVDLGCAPGGWCQVAVNRVNALGQPPSKPQGRVLGIDLAGNLLDQVVHEQHVAERLRHLGVIDAEETVM